MREQLEARLEALRRLLFPREVLSRQIFAVWSVLFALYGLLLLAATGAASARLLQSADMDLTEKVVVLVLTSPIAVVLGLGLGAMLLTVTLSVWVDICVKWANGMDSQHESE